MVADNFDNRTLADDFTKNDELSKLFVSNGTIYLFKTGGHPAIATNTKISVKDVVIRPHLFLGCCYC